MRSAIPKFQPLQRIRQVRSLVGKWPATPAEILEASAIRFGLEVPSGLKPSQRIAARESASALRAFRAWRDARKVPCAK